MKNDLSRLARKIVRSINTWAALRTPERLQTTIIREDGAMLVYSAVLDAAVDSDVVSQEVTVDVAGVPTVTSHPKEGATFEIRAADNDTVTLTTVAIDDAGNRSEARVQSFVATDTIAPSQPGEIAVTLVREE